jgi:hypothetical protein
MDSLTNKIRWRAAAIVADPLGRQRICCSKCADHRHPAPILCILAALICLLLSGCVGLPTKSSNPPDSKSTSTTNLAPHWGVQTKTYGCAVSGPLQDPACTPGDIFPTVTKEQVCTSGYASSVRNVPTSVKNKAYTEYGILKRLPGQYEVDHLVNLSIGGSNALANLWPEAINPKPGSREKDRVESYLHDQVCVGKISLQEAQIEIATNWLSVYNRMPGSAKAPATNGSSVP